MPRLLPGLRLVLEIGGVLLVLQLQLRRRVRVHLWSCCGFGIVSSSSHECLELRALGQLMVVVEMVDELMMAVQMLVVQMLVVVIMLKVLVLLLEMVVMVVWRLPRVWYHQRMGEHLCLA